jgi:nucleoside-diphosphate-sugar epimerase
MVVGNGMMAKAFSDIISDNSLIIFASGVSNSGEKDPAAFKRELDLLKSFVNKDSILIYFSTCSIYDPSLSKSDYIIHKLKMEDFISKNFRRYWIFRLPNVVGPSENPFTMCNFFYRSLSDNRSFDLQQDACRYFIDVDDVKRTLSNLFRLRELKNGIYNLLFPHPLYVKDLVEHFEKKLGKKGSYNLTEGKGKKYEVEISAELKPYASFIGEEPRKYFECIFDKYYFSSTKTILS